MGKESLTLADLFRSVVSGNTVNAIQNTATDLLRAVIKEDAVTTIYTAYTYSYDISGYTVPQAQGVLYNFYVNTGATLQTLDFGATGDTALSTYISGSTLTIPSGVTVTETATPYTGSTTTVTNYLNVNVSGSTAGSTGNGDWFSSMLTITGATILTAFNSYIRATGGTYAITLPATTGSGKHIVIKNLTAGEKIITPNGTDVIDSAATKVLTTQNASVILIDAAVGFWEIN